MARKYIGTSATALSLALVAALGLSGCNTRPAGKDGAKLGAAANPCGASAAALNSALPQNVGSNETAVDCFAWASFVALNWQADPAKPGYPDPAAGPGVFGVPGNTQTVWETYKEASVVFGPIKGQWLDKRPAVKTLTRISKFHTLDLTDITQAGSGNHWLTNQRGDITYYEVMMNRDEFEFITTQKGFDLTTAAGQLACAQQPGKVLPNDGPPVNPPPKGPLRGGLVMPEGNEPGWSDTDCAGDVRFFGDGVGAMEIKAAWTPLPADHSLDYRYKTATAQIQDPTTRTMRTVTVGLVGLHIARKRFPSNEWTWSTFEQIDNSPDEGPNGGWTAPTFPANSNQKPSPGFTFFNPDCQPGGNAYKCVHNAPPVPCTPSQLVCNPYNAPMQITRLNPVGAPANSVTAWYWSLMPANSVFNYYRLINVQWPTNPGSPLAPGQMVPLPQGTPKPAGNPNGQGNASTILANTTLESFQQSSAACMDCHVYATIASPPALRAGPNGLRKLTKAAASSQYASDYSFLFLTETQR